MVETGVLKLTLKNALKRFFKNVNCCYLVEKMIRLSLEI